MFNITFRISQKLNIDLKGCWWTIACVGVSEIWIEGDERVALKRTEGDSNGKWGERDVEIESRWEMKTEGSGKCMGSDSEMGGGTGKWIEGNQGRRRRRAVWCG